MVSMTTMEEGQERVLATAQHILKSLSTTSKDSTADMLHILSSFDNRLSNISDLMSSPSNLQRRISAAKAVVVRHLSLNGPLFDDPDDSCEFLAAVDELIDVLSSVYEDEVDLVEQAENVVQSAMSKLEDELRRLLVSNVVSLDVEWLNGCVDHATRTLSFVSRDGEVESFVHERGGSLVADVEVDLVSSDVVSDIRDIVDRMVRGNYGNECCQVYSSCRREGLENCLESLGFERSSIEEVQRFEWKQLDEKMKRWVQVFKIVVRVVLSSEKRFCETVFDGKHCDFIRDVCFVEAAKGCVLQLLNFGEAVGIGKRTPEKLFRALDMYDCLSDTRGHLSGLFKDECGEFVVEEAKGVLVLLGEAVRGTFVEFERAVKGEVSKKPAQGGEIHPLTRYVMNYVKLIVDYGDTLNKLMETGVVEGVEEGDEGKEMSPLGKRLTSLLNCLELNLEEKAKCYENDAMQCVFLMNNKLYVVQQVKDSELGKLLGDDWVKRRRGVIRKYATHYLRASWSQVLGCLRDEGIGSGSSNASKMVLKERFKSFNTGLEEIYRTQTAWKVPDNQLRDELLISISEKVIPAYRSFLGRFGPHLEKGRHSGKYIKYSVEDLDGYLGDLFGGTPCAIPHLRRKNS